MSAAALSPSAHLFIRQKNLQPNWRVRSSSGGSERGTPRLLKLAVSGVTELLRLFAPEKKTDIYTLDNEPSVSGVDDVIRILKSDYQRAYFLTGKFTSAIYADECLFEDPTIKFRGKEMYSRNLELLVPFFDFPSLELQKIEKGVNFDIQATWTLRTFLKLPWRPLISIEGTTIYDLDDDFKVVRHCESWSVSALEAVGQIFAPGYRDQA
ncbi:hypothetical protein H6P81_000925 [Aristolochia fimbriata]|uniref:Uncharacterized protein n=1 Tax=Aristolochia fimbriata TaxID=158543 RepID=A0AAV7F8S9_ARIFI|nr:hypothetical protein H6P81_000925 [Aristolochia fimbriata]